MDEIEHHEIQEYKANEFVVATPHRDLVLHCLDGTGTTVRAESRELGLTLVQLADVPAALGRAREKRERENGPTAGPRAPAHLQLDRLLTELRAIFSEKYERWQPVLGKNRVTRGVQYFPYPSGGGEGDPVPVPGAAGLRRALRGRDAGRRTRVAVLDSCIYGHEDLAGRYIANEGSILRPDNGPLRCLDGHATFIAGLILQRARGAQVEVESVLRSEEEPANNTVPRKGSADVWEIAERMIRYADSGVDVMNLSFGCFTFDNAPPLVLDRAVGLLAPKVVLVAASGNYGNPEAIQGVSTAAHSLVPRPKTPIWPAAFPDVVAVGAHDANGNVAAFTPKVPWIDFLAPGVDVRSTYLYGNVTGRDGNLIEPEFTGVARWSGTSFAAAAVSGAVAAHMTTGRRSAFEALDQLRKSARRPNGTNIVVANLT